MCDGLGFSTDLRMSGCAAGGLATLAQEIWGPDAPTFAVNADALGVVGVVMAEATEEVPFFAVPRTAGMVSDAFPRCTEWCV